MRSSSDSIHGPRVAAVVLALGVVAVAGNGWALLLTDDFEPIDATTNQAVITVGQGQPKTAMIQDCDGGPSFFTGTYDTLHSELSIDDGLLCAADIVISGPLFSLTVKDIEVRVGASAEVARPELPPFLPVVSTVQPDGSVAFGGLPALFSATLTVGSNPPTDLEARVTGNFVGTFGVASGSGRLALTAFNGVAQAEFDPDGPGGLPALPVVAELTLNLRSTQVAPIFEVFDDDFDLGNANAWDAIVGGR